MMENVKTAYKNCDNANHKFVYKYLCAGNNMN